MTLASGELLYRGISGRRHLLRALGFRTKRHRAQQEPRAHVEATAVERSLTIGKPANELHHLWREPQNLSRIMGHFAEITAAGADRLHWKVRGPLGRSMEWDSRIVEERPGELLRWESLEGAELPTQGSVSFHPAPGEWGTEVTLRMHFKPPGGMLGEAAMKRLRGVPSILVLKALRRFKSLAETGEIPTTAHNPSARRGADAD